MATDTQPGHRLSSKGPGGGRSEGGQPGVLRRVLLDNGALTALVLMIAAMTVLSDNFFSTQNLTNIAIQASVTAILAFGVTFVIVSGGIDLSVGSVAAFSAIMLGYLSTEQGLPVPVAIALAIATGTACGLVNGMLISYGKLPPFIATLAMLSIARGMALVVSQGEPILYPDVFADIDEKISVIVMAGMGLITAIVLARTYSGRSMYAIGGNEEAARLSGIRVPRQKLVIYALCGGFAAVAGIVMASRLASAQPDAAVGYELDAIAAVVIGGASLAGGVGKASWTLIGALILAVLRNALNLLEVSTFWQQVVIGAVIALAVLLDTLRRRA
ncbi:ABC transporter permease [Streptomyces sp. AJS327]|nr:ABC transporter permease [Streptomyces sp. AJS327]